MVKLTQIEDETEFQEQKTTSSGPVVQDEADFESESEASDDEDDFEDDFDINNETLCERISALKDIIPAPCRSKITCAASSTYNTLTSGLLKVGSITWVLTTGALLLGVPLSLSILAEQQLMELEKEFKLQQGANDILAQGDASAAAPVAA